MFFFDQYMPNPTKPASDEASTGGESEISKEADARGAKAARMAANGGKGDTGGQGKGRNGDRKRGAQSWADRGNPAGENRQWDNRFWRPRDRPDADVHQAIHALQKLILRHEDSISALKMDHSFVVFFRVQSPSSIVPQLSRAQQEWRRIKAAEPSKLNHPMRSTLLLCIFRELALRLSNIKDEAHVRVRVSSSS